MSRLKTVHRVTGSIIMVVLIYLSVTGLMMQSIDLTQIKSIGGNGAALPQHQWSYALYRLSQKDPEWEEEYPYGKGARPRQYDGENIFH